MVYQGIYDEIFKQCLAANSNTHDYSSSEEGYPFTYVGETFGDEETNKTHLTGDFTQTVHVWGERRNRKDLNDLLTQIKTNIRKIDRVSNKRVKITRIRQTVLPELNNTKELLHGVLEIEINLT